MLTLQISHQYEPTLKKHLILRYICFMNSQPFGVHRIIIKGSDAVGINLLLFRQYLPLPVEGGVERDMDIILHKVWVVGFSHAINLSIKMRIKIVEIIETFVITRRRGI